MKHLGTKKLQTKRLLLRPFKESDAKMMFENWAKDEDVTRYLLWFSHKELSETEEAIRSWVKLYNEKDYYHWAIVEKESGQLIGSITLFDLHPLFLIGKQHRGEVGYCLGKKWWKLGYASEAAAAILEFSFIELGLKEVRARHDQRNKASGRVMQRLSMAYVRKVEKAEPGRDGKWIDCEYYRLKKQDYFKAHPLDFQEKRFIFNGRKKILK